MITCLKYGNVFYHRILENDSTTVFNGQEKVSLFAINSICMNSINLLLFLGNVFASYCGHFSVKKTTKLPIITDYIAKLITPGE